MPAQLAQLGAGERGLRGPAPAEHDDLLDPALAQRLERVVGDVGARELVGAEREHARHVGRDVAVADHHRARRPRGRTRGRGSRGGRCTRRRTRWRPGCRAGPRPGCRATCRSARRSRRRRPCSAPSARRARCRRPTSTLPKKRQPRASVCASKVSSRRLISWWSGATPARSSPHGVGSRSNRSISTSPRRAQQRGGGERPGRPGADDRDPRGASRGRPVRSAVLALGEELARSARARSRTSRARRSRGRSRRRGTPRRRRRSRCRPRGRCRAARPSRSRGRPAWDGCSPPDRPRRRSRP